MGVIVTSSGLTVVSVTQERQRRLRFDPNQARA
jgi:hypothetical protein